MVIDYADFQSILAAGLEDQKGGYTENIKLDELQDKGIASDLRARNFVG